MAGTVGMPINGIINSTNIGIENLIPDIETRVINYDNDGNPFMSFFANPNSLALMQTDQVEYWWQENQLDYPNITLLSAIVDNATPGATQDVTVDMPNVQVLAVFTHLQSGQAFLVTDVKDVVPNVSCTITIKPFPFANDTSAIASGKTLRSLGTLMPDGGFYPAARGAAPKKLSNIVGARAYSVGITRRMMNSPTWYEGGAFEFSKQEELAQSKGDSERYYIWSQRADEAWQQNSPLGNGTINGSLTSTDGVFYRISTFADLYGGTLTEYQYDSYLNQDVFGQRNHGSNMKMQLVGPDARQDINTFAKQKYRIEEPANFRSVYGMDVSRVIFFDSTSVILFMEREFCEEEYRHEIMTLDMNHVKIRHKRDSYIEIHPDTQQNNQDAVQLSWVFEDGVQLEAEQFHSRLGWV